MREWLLSRRHGKRMSDRRLEPPPPRRPDRELARAIEQDEIGVRFQPQIDVLTGRVAGVEALARWSGAETPELLFTRATQARLSERLSRAVQRKALGIAGAWGGVLSDVRVSLNMLAEDIARPGYEDWLLEEIARSGLQPSRVAVEITESSLLADSHVAAQRLARLRAAGVRVAVDDFGTGYASLAYLTSLPLDTLKIDRGLIADLVGGSRDRIVVRAMIALARELGLQVVVEGVETSAQLELLSEWGCDLYQGFLGARALDEVELARFVRLRNVKTAPAGRPATAHA